MEGLGGRRSETEAASFIPTPIQEAIIEVDPNSAEIGESHEEITLKDEPVATA